MKKAFIVSLIVVVISVISGAILNNWKLTEQICGIIGLICLCTAGILSGAFISGDKSRANYTSQKEAERLQKTKFVKYLLALGLPNLIVALLVRFVL
jgi:hypothetical protein